VRVVLVGDGPQAADLRAQHPDFVFPGMRTGGDLAEHYASADVFLFASTTETFGNVTLEAMASGLALVAYDYAAARQYLRNETSALLVPLDDDAAFLRTAARLAESPGLASRLRTEARCAAETASWSRAFDDLERVLRSIAGASRGGRGAVREDSVHVET
jgi:glycosyltransferase involved in cell wall biosynthesis